MARVTPGPNPNPNLALP